MMRGAGGVVVLAVAVLLVSCSADPQQDQENNVGEQSGYDTSGHKSRSSESAGGGRLVRQTREIHHGLPYPAARRLEYSSPNGPRRELWPMMADYLESLNKRNFDEIDRSDLEPLVKRNFDEIDQTSMPFPYATKRFYHQHQHNFLDTPPYSFSSFDKKRLYRPEYPMDEIDLSHFPIGSKRSLDGFPHVRR